MVTPMNVMYRNVRITTTTREPKVHRVQRSSRFAWEVSLFGI